VPDTSPPPGTIAAAQVALPADASAPSVARRHVRAVLAGLGLDQHADAAELAVSELVTNALLHAGSQLRLRVVPRTGGRVRIEVTDGSERLPQARHYASTASVGRGLGMISALGSWGAHLLPGEGKVVWFEPAPDDAVTVVDTRAGEATGGTAPAADASDEPPGPTPRTPPSEAPPGRLVTVRLRGFPPQVFVTARLHHEELIREFALLALAPAAPGADRALPHRLVELIETLGNRYRTHADRLDRTEDAAVAHGDLTVVELTYQVPASVRESMIELDRLMSEADAFCEDEFLLTLAPDPISRAFRRWFTHEFIRQIDGRPPSPWPGPLHPPTPA
jgi:hypothetical protein